MLIAIDFDETFTLDPDFWSAVLLLAKQRGHSAICATMRFEHEGDEVKTAMRGLVENIIFTGRKAKVNAVEEAGYYPSVWIDDSPHWLLNNST